ncbi:RNA polymerase sigma factor [Marinobacter confluentis]|uniref:RNA polymerase sigma factor n=1 Tax=Marinobacter confluentis TaxID=1697557 RepID=A0A4Z1C2P3_9GAMM|nr:RNA polymerase sigma factor [Marinobacter confluentis]TGN40411.1 RNA polymerase sigma factor [Marinobacter confluentis]
MSEDISEQLVSLLPKLRRFATGLTGNLSDADDLVQQSCEKALRKQHQWQPGTRLDSWMYRIIQTTWIDQKRRQRSDTVSLDAEAVPETRDPRSEKAAENQNMLDRVSQVLKLLPEEQRVIMLLIAVEGRSYQEVSDMLELPKGTVMSRLYRARSRVQAELGSSDGPGQGSEHYGEKTQ